MKKGKDLMIKMAGEIYGYATDCSFNITTDTAEISKTKVKRASAAGKFKEYEADINSFDCSSNHVVSDDEADYIALVKAQLAGEAVDVEFLDVTDKSSGSGEKGATGNIEQATAGLKMSGQAIITSIQLSAPVDGEATFSISLQGTGELTPGKLS